MRGVHTRQSEDWGGGLRTNGDMAPAAAACSGGLLPHPCTRPARGHSSKRQQHSPPDASRTSSAAATSTPGKRRNRWRKSSRVVASDRPPTGGTAGRGTRGQPPLMPMHASNRNARTEDNLPNPPCIGLAPSPRQRKVDEAAHIWGVGQVHVPCSRVVPGTQTVGGGAFCTCHMLKSVTTPWWSQRGLGHTQQCNHTPAYPRKLQRRDLNRCYLSLRVEDPLSLCACLVLSLPVWSYARVFPYHLTPVPAPGRP
jgi:hypothetical protein